MNDEFMAIGTANKKTTKKLSPVEIFKKFRNVVFLSFGISVKSGKETFEIIFGKNNKAKTHWLAALYIATSSIFLLNCRRSIIESHLAGARIDELIKEGTLKFLNRSKFSLITLRLRKNDNSNLLNIFTRKKINIIN